MDIIQHICRLQYEIYFSEVVIEYYTTNLLLLKMVFGGTIPLDRSLKWLSFRNFLNRTPLSIHQSTSIRTSGKSKNSAKDEEKTENDLGFEDFRVWFGDLYGQKVRLAPTLFLLDDSFDAFHSPLLKKKSSRKRSDREYEWIFILTKDDLCCFSPDSQHPAPMGP